MIPASRSPPRSITPPGPPAAHSLFPPSSSLLELRGAASRDLMQSLRFKNCSVNIKPKELTAPARSSYAVFPCGDRLRVVSNTPDRTAASGSALLVTSITACLSARIAYYSSGSIQWQLGIRIAYPLPLRSGHS